LENCQASLLEISGHTSTIKTRFIASSQQLVRVDREVKLQLSDVQIEQLSTQSATQESSAVIVLSDYGKGVLSGSNAQRLVADGLRAGKYIIVDPKGSDYSRYRGASLITPNRLELHQATGHPVNTNEEIVEACRGLIEKFEFGAVIATLSERGMMVVPRDGAAVHLPSEAREVFDVSGAGDTVVATLAVATAVGVPLVEAAYMANRAAAVVVSKIGTEGFASRRDRRSGRKIRHGATGAAASARLEAVG
jgi:D-beta-D-heptose 7-phosphate kinase/D-beta-D-heptose 1-phosphate adenosyltransferase